jgi:hypothetical protein
VEMTSTAEETDEEKERACDVDLAAVIEAVSEALVWIQQRWRRCGVEADAEEERAHSVDPAAVEEAVGEAPTWILHRWRWRGTEADAEEERACDVDTAAVKAGTEKKWAHSVCNTLCHGNPNQSH